MSFSRRKGARGKATPRPILKLRGRAREAKTLGKALSLSMANQVVSSGTNFAILMYLVRTMGKAEFGLYSFGFALLLVLAGFISSSIAIQFVVNVPDQRAEQRADYALHHASLTILFGILTIAIGSTLSMLPVPILMGSINVTALALPVAAGAAGFGLRDLLMRVAYSERRESIVLISSLSVAGGVVIAFTGLWIFKCPLSAQVALFAYAIGQLTGCLTGSLLLRLPWKNFRWQGVCHAFNDAWAGGRWNLLTNVVYNLRTQAHNFVVAPLLGAAALAEINAARVLITPAVMAIPPLTQVLLPRLAARRLDGMPSLARVAFWTTAGLAGVILIYVLCLSIALPWIVPLVLGSNYQNVGPLVLVWCVVALLLALRNGLSMASEANRAFRDLLLANTAAAIIALALAVGLVKMLGAVGAIIALAAAEALLCVLLVMLLRRRTSFGGSTIAESDSGLHV